MALTRHYSVFHGIINKPHIYEAFTITFVEQSIIHSLDTCEDKWLHKPNAQMNIQCMILVRNNSCTTLRCSLIFLLYFRLNPFLATHVVF